MRRHISAALRRKYGGASASPPHYPPPAAPTRFNSTPLCASFAPCVSFNPRARFDSMRPCPSFPHPHPRTITHPRTSLDTLPAQVDPPHPCLSFVPLLNPPLAPPNGAAPAPLRNRPRAARPILPPKRKSPPHGGLFASFRRYSMSFSALLYCSQHRFRTTTR